jgi:anthranilate synthase component 2
LQILEPDFIFHHVPQQTPVGRYHSWVISREQLPETLLVTAIDDEGTIMAIRHRTLDITGLQFHPESILTPAGLQMMQNWLAG